MKSESFISATKLPWIDLGDGVSRQIVGYDKDIMLVKVKFTKGAVGVLHRHFHSQSSFVASGSFEVEINGKKEILREGDGFYAAPNETHGVVCLEDGILVDSFAPGRQDFL